MAETSEELVLTPGSFTGPERREVQQRFKIPFAGLLGYTVEAIRAGVDGPVSVLAGADGTLVFPDEVMQFMAWVQARRTNPAAQLDDFDGLTLGELHDARDRGLRGKAPTGNSSTTSSPESPSADSSPA